MVWSYEGRLTKIYRADVGGVKRGRGRLRKGLRDGVGEFVEQRGFSLVECERLARDRRDLIMC